MTEETVPVVEPVEEPFIEIPRPQYGLPTVRWVDLQRTWNSQVVLAYVKEHGPLVATADGEAIYVVMTIENYYALKQAAPKKQPEMIRVHGKLFREAL